MDVTSLDDILGGKDPEPTAAEPPVKEPAAKGEAEPKGQQPVVTDLPLPEGEAAAPPAAEEQGAARQVPLTALEAVRGERNDWKSKAVALETELKLLKEQAAKPAAPPPVQQQPGQGDEPPNIYDDPKGYARWMMARQEHALFNERCNVSEAILRREKPDVDAKLEAFRALTEKRPDLRAELVRQRDPYRWMYETVERETARAEIGDDPKSYEAKLREKIRAELLAEQSGVQPSAPVASPAPAVPSVPSLAAVPAAGHARNAPAWTGPTSLDDILKT